MIIVRMVLFIFLLVIAGLVFTVLWLWPHVRGASATGFDLLRALTIYSPVFWGLLALIWVVLWWVCRAWLRAAH